MIDTEIRIREERILPTASAHPSPAPWRFPWRGIALRLFITCWLIYTMHFATNTVREVYLALAIGDHLSFRVDEYANMHPDLFEKPGYGWHINNNPGVSMVGAIPYALSRPIIDPIVERINRARAAGDQLQPPTYNSPWPMAREFFVEAWRRGYDVKFGLASFVMQSFAMAPSSALGVVAMFLLLRLLLRSDKIALGLSLLYAFGTPVFFRTGYLNHNLMLGHIAFVGFLALWNPSRSERWSPEVRFALGGIAGGAALLFDYSGVVLLLGLFVYGIAKRRSVASFDDTARQVVWYVVGALGPVFLLWFYQWQSFGNPFLPAQQWMPAVAWSDLGYRGYGWPQLDVFSSLAFDYRSGLFTSSPIILLAFLCPLLDRGHRRVLPKLEMVFILVIFAAFWIFFSGSNYSRLEYNTGVRFMTAMLPFIFVPVAVVLMRFPRLAVYFIAVLAVTESWTLAMYRDVERSLGLLEPVLHVFTGGLQLPALSTLSRMGSAYGDYVAHGVSPLPIFLLLAAILYGLWGFRVQHSDLSGQQIVS